MEGGKEVRQPIATVSQKFSKTASRWPTIKQEAYAIFKSVEKLEYLLSLLENKKWLLKWVTKVVLTLF